MEILETPAARAVLGVTVLAILTTIAHYVVTNYRDRIDQDIPGPEEHLDNFQEIHSQGDISDKEFRTIETVLEQQLEHQQSQPDDQPPTEDKSDG